MKFETFSTWHVRARTERGFSQTQIANKLGWVSPQYISNIERGISFLPKKKIKKIASIYKVSAVYIAMLVISDIKRDYFEYLEKH